jgi:hypothetical protein
MLVITPPATTIEESMLVITPPTTTIEESMLVITPPTVYCTEVSTLNITPPMSPYKRKDIHLTISPTFFYEDETVLHVY